LKNDHPVNIEPGLGAAVNVTSEAWSNVPLHVVEQLLMPAGKLELTPVGTAVTLPDPVLPPGRTWTCCCVARKFAVIEKSLLKLFR